MSAGRPHVTPELVTFAAVLTILLGLVGAIGYLWSQPRAPATLTVELVGDDRLVGTQRYVTAQVANSGDETAEAVQVIAEMIVDDEVLATGEQFVDFLSGDETEEIVFIFDSGPPDVRIELRVAGYTVP